MFPALIVARGVLAPAATLAVTALIGWRLGFAWVARQVGPRERLLLVGTGTAALALARELQAHEEDGVQIVGFVDADVNSHGVGRAAGRSSGPSTTSPRSCARGRWTASWSASPMRAASCRWTSCSR